MKKIEWIEKYFSWEDRNLPKRFTKKDIKVIENVLNKLNKEVFEWRVDKNQYHSIVIRVKSYNKKKNNAIFRAMKEIEKDI